MVINDIKSNLHYKATYTKQYVSNYVTKTKFNENVCIALRLHHLTKPI